MVNCLRIKNHLYSDFNFVRNKDGACASTGPDRLPPGQQCLKVGDTYKGTSGYRRIPGDTCDRSAGKVLDQPIDRICRSGKCQYFYQKLMIGKTKYPLNLLWIFAINR